MSDREELVVHRSKVRKSGAVESRRTGSNVPLGRALIWLAVSVLSSALLTGCPGMMAAPARHTSLHGARGVPPGNFEVQVSGGGHLAHAVYPTSHGISGSLDVRTGLSERFGLQLGGTAFRLFAARTPEQQWRGYLFSGRGDLEYHPTDLEAIALEAGFGGGSSLAGTYVSPDVGMVVSSDVSIFQVVFGFSLYGSVPITTPEVGSPPLAEPPDTTGFFGQVSALPDRAYRGAGVHGWLGLNQQVVEPTDSNPGLKVRSALGTTSGVDFGRERRDREDTQFTGRVDVWFGVGLALEL